MKKHKYTVSTRQGHPVICTDDCTVFVHYITGMWLGHIWEPISSTWLEMLPCEAERLAARLLPFTGKPKQS